MDAVSTAQDQQALLAQLAQAREKLDGLVRDLRTVEGELDRLAPEREQHRLLHEACTALQQLGAKGGASLFWGDDAAARASDARVAQARVRIDAFQRRVDEIEGRRRALLEEVEQQQDQAWLIEDDVTEAKEEEERRKYEWIVEREVGQLHARELVMPWARRGEDDDRFRKTLATAVLVSLVFALIIPRIDIPLPKLSAQAVKVPERVVKLMMESRKIAPPRREEVQPKPQERLAEQKPVEKVVPRQEAKPDKVDQAKGLDEPRRDVVEPEKGILAFREKLAAVKNAQVSSRLGLQARLSAADDNSPGPPQRSMLTTNGPGSSGGINLASLSRGLGGEKGGGGGSMAGVQVTRATSAIGGGGGGGNGASDRPLASGARAARTDEEIQIVFDRYKAALYRLYNRELRKDPTLRGQMVLRLTIEPDGSVSMCVLQASDMNAPDLSAQVVDRVRTINFGAKEVDAITIVYPIDFLPAA
ncbi:MAG TPA: AgmX/PglI C-terminal domain-containing protein [Steroidobacteraceae bacterium]|nr:AgmX/PglI C-terminal domain-containing protein [Steroidobacteraceae bacterium]